MSNFWIILAAISIIALIIFWKEKSAIWGGLTIGAIVGLIVTIIKVGFDWNIIAKGAIIGALVGIGSELLSRIGKLLKRKT